MASHVKRAKCHVPLYTVYFVRAGTFRESKKRPGSYRNSRVSGQQYIQRDKKMRQSLEKDKKDRRGACDDGLESGRINRSERRATFNFAAIATNNPGRRFRAPSRKALEAAGQAADEGMQWMMTAKKQEEARKGREKRQERKAAAAAGLKTGEVMENSAAGDESNNVHGLSNESNHGKGTEMSSTKDATTRRAGNTPKHDAAVPPPTGLGGACKRSAVVNGNARTKSSKGRKGPSVPHTIDIKKQDVKERNAGERQESGRRGVFGSGGGYNGTTGPTCESAGCTRVATFGVNGAVRYWWVVPWSGTIRTLVLVHSCASRSLDGISSINRRERSP